MHSKTDLAANVDAGCDRQIVTTIDAIAINFDIAGSVDGLGMVA